MAAFGQLQQTAMSVASSSELVPDLLLHLPRLAVPRDQHQLLADKNSWAVLADSRPYGMAHVPGHVLETLKDAHKRTKNPSNKTDANGSNPPDKDLQRGNGCPIVKDAVQYPASSPTSSPGAPLSSWSPSPSNRSKIAPQPQPPMERSIAREVPVSAQMGPPPAPAIVPDVPGSDVEELETQLPQATSQAHVAVNRAASPLKFTATPQSTNESTFSQPPLPSQHNELVPGTVFHDTASNTRPSDNNPARKKFKPIVFDHGPRPPRSCLEASHGMTRYLKSESVINSSKSPSSDSVVPATCATPSPLDPLVVAVKNHAATTKHGGPANRDQRNQLSGDQGVNKVHLNTYDKFTQTYPDYVTDHSGSLDYFIKACVYIEYLRKTWPLRECYYDELIRAFSGQYISYVQNTGPGQQPLPAIEWFSTLPGVSLYNRLVVTNDELDLILRFFPVHVAAARSIIRDVETKAVQDHHEPPKSPDKPTRESPEKQAKMQPDNDAALSNTTSSTSLAKDSSAKPLAAAHRFSTGTMLPSTPRVRNKVPKEPLPRSPELGFVSPLAVPSTAPAAPTGRKRSSAMTELQILSSKSNWTPEEEEAYRKRVRHWKMRRESSRLGRTEG
ncbi:hypothetical protein CDD81_7880 [Ophiocordyceps australis]|uniref:Uncharacterized protein n=1 Tax=Ophiocordyceps australis TaxID=1399860 RepID=A0A2C5YC50_9HYPO|nr:hypothetical protein CDD81_7880 [Ophiocordyceps australis]